MSTFDFDYFVGLFCKSVSRQAESGIEGGEVAISLHLRRLLGKVAQRRGDASPQKHLQGQLWR